MPNYLLDLENDIVTYDDKEYYNYNEFEESIKQDFIVAELEKEKARLQKQIDNSMAPFWHIMCYFSIPFSITIGGLISIFAFIPWQEFTLKVILPSLGGGMLLETISLLFYKKYKKEEMKLENLLYNHNIILDIEKEKQENMQRKRNKHLKKVNTKAIYIEDVDIPSVKINDEKVLKRERKKNKVNY